ncbi:MAG: CYTH domain-containing protein [Flavobacteriaceae bacterium]
MIEIERKFLVLSDAFKQDAFKETRITQGFLCTDPERTVRVRVKGEQGFLTVKGASNASGTSRFEWEKDIGVEEAQSLLKICKQGVIDKIRYEVKMGDHIFEVDEFFADNTGLIIAEVELTSEDEVFEQPIWLGEEVTGDARYYNSQLSLNPFCKW